MITADEIYRCLQAIERHHQLEEYENLGVWTVGGNNNTYVIKSPVNTEAEWSVYAITSTNTCPVLISQNPGGNTLDKTGATSYGLSGNSEGNALEGIFFLSPAGGNSALTPNWYWQPSGRGNSVYINISGLSGGQSCFVSIAWRRLLLRSLALVESREVSRHVLPQHTNPQRVLPAESVQTAGFQEGRYALPGGRPYRHKVSPGNPIDPGWTNVGGEIARPLTPLEILRAKTRQAKGGVG